MTDDAGERVHELKTWPPFFAEVVAGWKTFEIRRDDRGFATGDTLVLKEWHPGSASYTGKTHRVRVTYVTAWEQKPGFVVMAITPSENSDAR